MSTSFYFYDLETSGINPRDARIMQFAGQRTDMDLNPIGEPHNILIKLSDDVLPEPEAILITGITPQQTIAEGVTEAEFLRTFYEEVAIEGTIFVGFNTVRFDDEFMRYIHYRNFYDPYEWQYTEGKSRWDLLDVVRMTRALRPEGVEWPVDSKGSPSNRLELLTSVNKISHVGAHDALSDVRATIDLARLLKTKQPKLFEFLLKLRDKKAAAQLVGEGKPFLYSSGKYESEFEKTTAVGVIADHPKRQGALVFDLRHNLEDYVNLSVQELAEAWRRRRDDPGIRLPVKTLQYNRCPAIAPLSVLDAKSAKRLQLKPEQIAENFKKLQSANLAPKILEALELLDKQQQTRFLEDSQDVDSRLYDGFIGNTDKNSIRVVRAADATELSTLDIPFTDQRLVALLPLYKARNYPKILSDEERATWENFRQNKLMSGGQDSKMARYFKRLAEVAERKGLTSNEQYLLEELQLYGQSIMPVEDV